MKRILPVFILFLKFSFVTLILLTFNTVSFAEYYVVYNAPVVCLYCSKSPVKKHRAHVKHIKKKPCVSHHRPQKNRDRIEVFYPYSLPTCCGAVWVQNACNPCGEWVTTRAPVRDEFVSYAPSQDAGQEELSEDYYYSDMATADDNAYRHPDMQINW